MLASVLGCQEGNTEVLSTGVGNTLLLYLANLTTAVTAVSSIALGLVYKKGKHQEMLLWW